MADVLHLTTPDGHSLEGELAVAPDARAIAVLCHPHPQYGGDMRSLVISELFGAFPGAGISALRFNFRGVGASTGAWSSGVGEAVDVQAAVAVAADASSGPVVLVGWSFGADMALGTRDPSIAGWVAIAPPLRFGDQFEVTGADPRPKLLLLAEHDEFSAPDEIAAEIAGWQSCTSEIVGGASHFFVGRTNHLVDRATAWITDLT